MSSLLHKKFVSRRRAFLRPHIEEKYKSVAKRDLPITAHLFGEDLDKKVEVLDKTKDIIEKPKKDKIRKNRFARFANSSPGYQSSEHFQRFDHGSSNSSPRRPFLEGNGGRRDRQFNYPPKKHQSQQNQSNKSPFYQPTQSSSRNQKQPIHQELRKIAEDEVSRLKSSILNTKENFKGGKLKYFIHNWEQITSDETILSWVRGVHIGFEPGLRQLFVPSQRSFGPEEDNFVNQKVNELLQKGIIEPSSHEDGEIISTIFIVEKKGGGYRLILNLKPFNDQIENVHFKMETLENVIQMMKPASFMASIDWADAYFSVPVAKEHRLVLKFIWKGQLYEFTCFAMGLCEAPRKFTKLGKTLFSHLRKWGHENAIYLDDSWLQSDTFLQCLDNVSDTVSLSDALGFTINFEKSHLIPTQRIEYLGCILDSLLMAVFLTPQKTRKIQDLSQAFLTFDRCSIRRLAQLLGCFISCKVVVPPCPSLLQTFRNF